MVKFALLVGINYRNTSNELHGCINDIHVMKDYLISKRGYQADNITLLTEDQSLPYRPTCSNILREFERLILRSPPAEELFFHYSGHGSYVVDRNGDEADGRDETIVPLDYDSAGMITDDKLHTYLERLSPSCQLYCLFDCCHSGTILDLKYLYRGGRENVTENKSSRLTGNIIMISGCKDDQTSADAMISGKWSGAMTAAFTACIKDDITCDTLLRNMREYLKKGGYEQIPQLCCTTEVTADRRLY